MTEWDYAVIRLLIRIAVAIVAATIVVVSLLYSSPNGLYTSRGMAMTSSPKIPGSGIDLISLESFHRGRMNHIHNSHVHKEHLSTWQTSNDDLLDTQDEVQ